MAARARQRVLQVPEPSDTNREVVVETGMDWRTVAVNWRSLGPSHPDASTLPARFATPAVPWNYGAITDLIHTEAPSTLRIRATALNGVVGIALVNDDSSERRSIEKVLRPQDGPQTLEIRFFPRKSPARLMVRTYGDEPIAGEVVIDSLEMRSDPDATQIIQAPAASSIQHSDAPYDLIAGLVAQSQGLEQLKAQIVTGLRELNDEQTFGLSQGLMLGAMIRDFAPDVVLDLGTGLGGSALAMAMADRQVPIYTFDLAPQWDRWAGMVVTDFPANVRPMVTDIAAYDYTSLLKGAGRVMIFWDAHGFEIAARVLSHIMPMIADRPHLVFCHDITDIRQQQVDDESGSYNGLRMWRGYPDYNADPQATAQAYIGWMLTSVDQAIAIGDFAHRNRMPIHTADQALHEADDADRARIRVMLGDGAVGLTYFSMNETHLRHFPAS
jgi:hypothetical protein